MLAYNYKEIIMKKNQSIFKGFFGLLALAILFVSGCKKIEDDCPLYQNCPICFQWENLKNVISQELERLNFENLANNEIHINKINFFGLNSETPLATSK